MSPFAARPGSSMPARTWDRRGVPLIGRDVLRPVEGGAQQAAIADSRGSAMLGDLFIMRDQNRCQTNP